MKWGWWVEIFKKRVDPHLVLNYAFSKIRVNGVYPKLIKSRFNKVVTSNKLLNLIWFIGANIFLSIDATFYLLMNKKSFVVIREFSSQITLLSFPAYIFFKDRILFNVNHNVKRAHLEIPFSMRVLCRLGFKFILFDGGTSENTLLKKYHGNFLFPFFPIKASKSVNDKPHIGDIITIGVVGDFRSEKLDNTKLKFILSRFTDCGLRVKVGFRYLDKDLPDWANSLDVVSTRSSQDYNNFLINLDALVIFAEEDSYYFRHSGTIMDAISHGVIPIVPDFPVFNRQINFPLSVGFVYRNIDELYEILASDIRVHIIEKRKNLGAFVSRRSETQNLLL
jgi:hypothetical protein